MKIINSSICILREGEGGREGGREGRKRKGKRRIGCLIQKCINYEFLSALIS